MGRAGQAVNARVARRYPPAMRRPAAFLVLLAVSAGWTLPASAAPGEPAGDAAQPTEYRPDESGRFVPTAVPAPGSPEETIANARRALAEDRPDDAYEIINPWIEANQRSGSPLLPQAYLIRADATSLGGSEFEALYDYEAVIKQFAGTPEYVTSIERELEIAVRYVNGLDRKFLGMRILDASDVGVELLIRVQERLPGSRLAERAGIELADYYYRDRQMGLAGEAYQLFLENFPQSPYRLHAMQRRIYASVARFKGPRYDTLPLLDAQVNIRRFRSLYPTEAQQAGIDDALLTRIDESGGQHMLEVARYYETRDDPVAARYQLRRLLAQHPQTAAAAEAIRLMQARGWMTSAPAVTPGPLDPLPLPEPAPPAAVPATPSASPSEPPESPAPTPPPAAPRESFDQWTRPSRGVPAPATPGPSTPAPGTPPASQGQPRR